MILQEKRAIVTEASLPLHSGPWRLGGGTPCATEAKDSKFLAQVNDQHYGHCGRAQSQPKGNYDRVIVDVWTAQVSRCKYLVAYTFTSCPVTAQRQPQPRIGLDYARSCRWCTAGTSELHRKTLGKCNER
jgi:hypothetical protein